MGNENIFTSEDKVREDGVKIHKGEDGLYYYSQPNSNRVDHVVDLSNGPNNKGATYYEYNPDGTVKSTMNVDKKTYMDLAEKKKRPVIGKTPGKATYYYYKNGKLDHTAEIIKENGENARPIENRSATSTGLKAQAQFSKMSNGSQLSSSKDVDRFNQYVDAHQQVETQNRTVTNAPVKRQTNTR